MRRAALSVCILLFALTASAETRDGWVRSCQAKDSTLSGPSGHRICTGRYLTHLEKRQAGLLKKIKALFAEPGAEGANPVEAWRQLADSQAHWLRYANAHCQAAQHMFGVGNASGDVIPSCLVGEYESRNKQLARILEGNYER